MHPGKRDTDGCNEIHLIIQTLSRLYRAQRQDAYHETDKGDLDERISEVHLERAKSAPARNRNHPDPVNRIFRIQDALGELKTNLKDVNRLQLDVKTELDIKLHSLLKVVKCADSHGTLHIREVETELEDITKKLFELMGKVSVLPERRRKKRASPDNQENHGKYILYVPGIHANEEDLKRHAFFRYVKSIFQALSTDCQICLLSFAVFPENREINGTMLMYWWIGEGILPVAEAEATAKDILQTFMERKLIEPVENNRKVKPSSYKMTPFVHSSLVLISKEIGLFDIYHKGQKPTMKKSNLKKVCLVDGSSSQPEAKATKMGPADIETVFNVSEKFPDFIFKWFSSMEVLKVLYLGRWERTEGEIEVDSHGLMKDLSSMGKLRFLSFQGITTIISISPSACKLPELIILDLRGCYSLEQLPANIDNLKNLVYLDLTGCDALENIPLRLALLSNLEVLKGFVVADEREIACKLVHLNRLRRLRKLSVRVDQKGFGLDDLIVAIQEFHALEKLKVRWGSEFPLIKQQRDNVARRIIKKNLSRNISSPLMQRSRHPLMQRSCQDLLPERLRKLDLQRFPDSKLPLWLQPQSLGRLEELHLGSSRRLRKFSELPVPGWLVSNCNVKVLRLKSLQKLKVDWIELMELYFPKLLFLEIYECPRVTLCPCDRDGIWKAYEDYSPTL